MDQPRFAVVCDYASIAQDGKITLAGIFDRVFAPGFPARHAKLTVAASLALPKGRHAVGIRVMSPRGPVPMPIPQLPPLDVLQEGPSNILMELQDLPLNEPGRFRAEIYVDNKLAASVPFDVVLVAGAQTPRGT